SAQTSFLYGDGLVAHAAPAMLRGVRSTGDTEGALWGPGVVNPLGAEIHLVLRDHGVATSETAYAMTHSFGACNPTCSVVQPAGPFGVNFLMPFVDPHAVEVAAGGSRVVEFFYGRPDVSLVDLVHAGGALCSWQVGSKDEALAAVDCGCDLVVVQGVEAGGHV